MLTRTFTNQKQGHKTSQQSSIFTSGFVCVCVWLVKGGGVNFLNKSSTYIALFIHCFMFLNMRTDFKVESNASQFISHFQQKGGGDIVRVGIKLKGPLSEKEMTGISSPKRGHYIPCIRFSTLSYCSLLVSRSKSPSFTSAIDGKMYLRLNVDCMAFEKQENNCKCHLNRVCFISRLLPVFVKEKGADHLKAEHQLLLFRFLRLYGKNVTLNH